ncbi:MAG: ATP phosphoribosyltransferase regulatory subunit [Synergistaceae bacterium]|nr:ATP phosphoribosyltransferase regulatory subunit [Synergistaceae bacterium]
MYEDVLTIEERYGLTLRTLWHSHGYQHKRMSRFEDYDYYAGKKDFLTSSAILTFTDTNGKLKALRPDVTLSLIRRASAGKYYYDEKVYRVSENTGAWSEIPQAGIECLGDLHVNELVDVANLALMSLHELSGGRDYVLDVADAGCVSELLTGNDGGDLLKCLQDKNIHGLKALNAPKKLLHMASLDGSIASGLEFLGTECRHVVSALNDAHIRIDFSTVSNLKYYNGLVLKGYIEGIPRAVLSGGQYDNMMRIAGNSMRGAGFAVYLGRIAGDYGD